MKPSIFIKIITGYLLIIFIFSLVIILFTDRLIRNLYTEQSSINLKKSIVLISPQMLNLINDKKYKELYRLTKSLGKETKTRITVIDPSGIVLGDSEGEPESMENQKNRPEIINALKNGFGESIRYSSTLSSEMLYVAMLVRDSGDTKCIIRMGVPMTEIEELSSNLKRKITGIAIMSGLLFLIVVILVSKRFTNAISIIAEAAHRVAYGDFDLKILLNRNDELRELADSFNFMSSQIKIGFEKLKGQKAELDVILNSINEGLILIDEDRKIILSNKSFKKIFGIKDPDGKLLVEVIRSPELNEALNMFLKKKEPITAEFQYKNNFYASNFTSANGEYIVIIIHDISEFKRLEKMKRDFVSNISHELRTPLTAIKGFVETIDEKVDEENKSYLTIIKRNIERIISIVNDLLTLSELEDRESKLVIDKVNLKELLESLYKLFEKQLKEKALYLKIVISEDAETILGDNFKLEQLFTNLIDNAIKYTEEGGITIDVKREDKKVKIIIEDTGIGIPEEHLQRIFERFYVVDKSRSRKSGGTGLGLSIVKHIILLHNGDINVESKPGKGTRFTIILPENPE